MASFNDFMQGMVKGAGDIADEIANSGFYKNVVPTVDGFAQELNHAVGSNQKAKISYLQNALDKEIAARARKPLEKAGLDNATIDSVSQRMANALHGTDYSDEAISKLADIMRQNNVDEKMIDKFSGKASDAVQNILKQDVSIESPTLVGGLTHPLMYAKTYFNNPDPKVRNHRIAAVAGTYGAVAVGGRLLSGGTITEDNYGRRDIAGIPFI